VYVLGAWLQYNVTSYMLHNKCYIIMHVATYCMLQCNMHVTIYCVLQQASCLAGKGPRFPCLNVYTVCSRSIRDNKIKYSLNFRIQFVRGSGD